MKTKTIVLMANHPHPNSGFLQHSKTLEVQVFRILSLQMNEAVIVVQSAFYYFIQQNEIFN